jgi:hypothetical protein
MSGPNSGRSRGRFRAAVRWFVLGSGPLKRRSDRIQMVGRILLTLSLLAAAPLAVLGSSLVRGHLEAVAREQALDRHAVSALVRGTHPAEPGDSAVLADVGWTAGGADRHGSQLVPAGTSAGSSVTVWVDRTGRPTSPPLDRAVIGDSGLAVAIAVAAAVPLLGAVLYHVLCTVLEVQRARRWAQGWARVEREWRTRLR